MITPKATDYSNRKYASLKPLYYRDLGPSYELYSQAVEEILKDPYTDQLSRGYTGSKNPKKYFQNLIADFSTDDNSTSIGDTTLTTASYMDTSIGGNDVMNPYPSFNFDDDIIHPMNEIPKHKVNESLQCPFRGLGRVYKEVYQDQQKVLWLTFGVPQFNDPQKYYSNAGSSKLAEVMMNGGDEDVNLLSTLGTLISTAGKVVFTIYFFPIVTVLWLGKVVSDSIINDHITKYYDFKPATIQYYKIWNSLICELAVSQGLYSGETSTEINPLSIPEVLSDGPDIFAILNKRNKLMTKGTVTNLEVANGSTVKYPDTLSAGGKSSDGAIIKGTAPEGAGDTGTAELYEGATKEIVATANTTPNLTTTSSKEKRFENYNPKLDDVKSTDAKNASSASITTPTTTEKEPSFIDNFVNNYLKAGAWVDTLKNSAKGADQFVGFRIEKSTDTNESLNNNTGPSELAGMLNNSGKTMRSYKFAAPGTMDTAGQALSFITDFLRSVGGTVGSITDSGTTMLFGNGQFDMPEIWQDSSFTKSYNFSAEFNARLGDPVSIFQNYIGMLGIVSGGMPRAIGTNMYTSPFICQAYCQGMFAVPLGMIDSMTLRRGGADYGWNTMSLPTTINVTFTIKDLSPMMFLAIAGDGGTIDALKDIFSNNAVMHEYMATLSGMGLADRKRFGKRLKRKWDTFVAIARSTTFNPTYWAMKVGNWNGVRTIGTMLGAPAWPSN